VGEFEELAESVVPGARQDFHRVQDALLRHSPDRNPADAEHLRRLLLSNQKPFIHPNGDGSAALPLPFEKKLMAILREGTEISSGGTRP